MITGPFIFIVTCFVVIIIVQTLVPAATAMKQPSSNLDDYMAEDPGSRKRYNYRLQRMEGNEISKNTDNIYLTHVTEPFDPDTNPEELSAFILDYANVLRNDVILLDNSVETRTRKRGNMKVQKKYNQAFPDSPCSCQYDTKTIDLGDNVYPKYVQTGNCSSVQQTCVPPYKCEEIEYYISIMRKKDSMKLLQSVTPVPSELKHYWIGEIIPVNVGCVCTGTYMTQN